MQKTERHPSQNVVWLDNLNRQAAPDSSRQALVRRARLKMAYETGEVAAVATVSVSIAADGSVHKLIAGVADEDVPALIFHLQRAIFEVCNWADPSATARVGSG